MTATGGSWFSANTLVNHSVQAKSLQSQHEAVRNDPNTLISFYDIVPENDIALPQFEEWGIARLRTLRGIEQIMTLNKKPADAQTAASGLLDKHMKIAGNPVATKQLDSASHFILRLAFCTTKENRRWLISRECELFKHRYNCLTVSEKAEFLEQCDLPYPLITPDELDTFATQLSQVAFYTYLARPPDNGPPEPLTTQELSDMGFRKVPFENVPDLVGTRRVFLHNGFAFVPNEFLCSVITPLFRQRLSRALVVTAGRWASSFQDEENDRLVPILKALAKRQALEEISSKNIGDGVKVSLQDIPALSQRHFPMCMQHLYNTLMADRHLRHAGRQQFGLFLKKAGLTLEESMLFWKTSFAPRTPSDKFEKEYAYNIRHRYGKEGGRKDYEAQRCSQIIPSNPGVGEANGCPFKTFNKEVLKDALERQGLSDGKVSEVLRLAKEGHYQVACDRTFEAVHGERPDKLIEHPNEYLAAAINVQKSQAPAAMATPSAVAGNRTSTASSMSGTPGAFSGTPNQGTPYTGQSGQAPAFLRTPINITPTLAALRGASTGTPPPSHPGAAAPTRAAANSIAQGEDAAGVAQAGSPIAGIVTSDNPVH